MPTTTPTPTPTPTPSPTPTGFKNGNPGCCCGSSGGHTITGCPCTNLPGTMAVSIDNTFNPSPPPTAPLVWQAKPPDILSTGFGDPGYYSARVTPASGGYAGHIYRFTFDCISGHYQLTLIYTTDDPSGLANSDEGWGSYLVGDGNSTCSPPHFHDPRLGSTVG